MLITLEFLFGTDLRRSLFTAGVLEPEQMPAFESAVTDYVEQYATTPPGEWVRLYRGKYWLTRSVPARPFYDFLKDWQHVPEVSRFVRETFGYSKARMVIPGTRTDIWVGWPDGSEPVEAGLYPPGADRIALVA